jgi:ABC-type branched-subunit amino acid transport system permease subunit
MGSRAVQFLAIVLTAVALVPAGAHLFELPNKIGLAQEPYFIVQNIYRGWALFGIVLFGALAANLALTIALRRQRAAFWLALAGFLLVALTLAIFFTWTYPANQATANWTVAPENWQALRTQWEYAHAANALLTFLALCSVTLAALLARERAPDGRADQTE